jgi:hypothetical protein
MATGPRKPIPSATELLVLDGSRRRCALCYQMKGDLSEKRGQIAHLDHNRANFAAGNLAWLCFDHHSEYDSRTSQHKNYTLAEAKKARDELYIAIQEGRHLAAPAVRIEGRNADRKTLADIVSALSEVVFFLRKFSFNGTSFPVFKTDSIDSFLHLCQEPVYEFVDVQLEAERKGLIDRLSRLGRLIDRVTRPVPGQSGWYRIPIELLDTKPAEYNKLAGRFDAAARQICERYDNLVRTARRKLEP